MPAKKTMFGDSDGEEDFKPIPVAKPKSTVKRGLAFMDDSDWNLYSIYIFLYL